jgi:hypothetical protein
MMGDRGVVRDVKALDICYDRSVKCIAEAFNPITKFCKDKTLEYTAAWEFHTASIHYNEEKSMGLQRKLIKEQIMSDIIGRMPPKD